MIKISSLNSICLLEKASSFFLLQSQSFQYQVCIFSDLRSFSKNYKFYLRKGSEVVFFQLLRRKI